MFYGIFFSNYSIIVATIFHYMAHLTGFEELTPPNCRVNKSERRILRVVLEPAIARQQVFK